jgi:hypothetical protein
LRAALERHARRPVSKLTHADLQAAIAAKAVKERPRERILSLAELGASPTCTRQAPGNPGARE